MNQEEALISQILDLQMEVAQLKAKISSHLVILVVLQSQLAWA